MNNWEKVTLSELGKIITGKTPKTAISENYGDYIQFLTPSDDMNIKYCTYTNRMLSKVGLKEVSNNLLPANSICVSCIGSDLGKVIITTKETVTNQQINSIIVNENYNVDFVYYAMLILGKKMNFISKTSTAVPIINKSTFSNYTINIPVDKDEQKRIADVLSALDDKIEINNKINENLEAQAQAIFKQWFVDFEFPDKEGKPYKSNGGKFIDSELGEIPLGWKVGTLGEFIHFIKGKKPKNIVEEKLEGYELYLTIDALTSSNSTYSETEKNVLVNELDLLMVMDGASSGTMYFGKKGIVGSTLSKIELFDNDYKEIIYRCLKYYESEIKAHTTGSAIPHTDKNYVLQLHFIYPHIIMPSCDIFINIREQQIIKQQENQKLSEIRDSLLPKLMSGEVRV